MKLRPLKEGNGGLLLPAVTGGVGRVVVASPLSEQLTEEEGSSILKFALFCGNNPVSQQVTVYIDDVNNHPPLFLDRNVSIVVDEMTPTGLVVLSEIRVYDSDKANTANSEVELYLEMQRPVNEESYLPSGLKFLESLGERTNVKTLGNRDNERGFLNSSESFLKPEFHQGHYTDEDYFAMTDQKKGEIRLIRALDFDEGPRNFYLKIIAKDMGEPPLTSESWIHIQVKDSDDRNPVFTSAIYTASIYEHPGPDIGESIQVKVETFPEPVRAYDGDLGINIALDYSIVSGESSHFFSIDSITGDLFVTQHLDRELLKDNTLTIHLLARQVDNPGREGSAEVRVTVEDVNDNLPYFENDVYAISIMENLPTGFSVVQVAAFDPDLGENGEFTYFVKRNGTPVSVNPNTGWLTVANQSMLDREKAQDMSLEVCTRQKRSIVDLSGDVATAVSLEPDITRSQSRIDGLTQTFPFMAELVTDRLNESLEITTAPPSPITVQSISPVIRSLPPSALIRERLQREHTTSNNPVRESRSKFPKPEDSLGRLLASRRFLSRQVFFQNETWRSEGRSRRDTKVTRGFRDRNGRFVPIQYLQRNKTVEPPCAVIKLTLLDANDNNPVFVPSNHYEFTIFDDMKIGEIVGTIRATDKDTGENGIVNYNIQSQSKRAVSANDYFDINATSGVLRVKSDLIPGFLTLFVEASDSPSSPSETRTSLAVVLLNIKPHNSFQPQFQGAPYEFWVGAEAPVGTSLGQVKVSDMDSKNIVFDMFHSYAEEVPFGIEETTGIVAVTKLLQDFTRPRYDLEALVSAPANGRINKVELYTNVTIHVAPAPRSGTPRDITITFKIPENLSGGRVGDVLRSLRTDGVRVPRDPRFQLVSPESKEFFTLASDGLLYTVAPLDYEVKDTHTLVIVSGRTSMIIYVIVQVEDLNDNPPQFNAVHYKGIVQENVPPGSTVNIAPLIQVTDSDSYPGSAWTLSIIGDASGQFSYKKESNEIIFVGRKIDRESESFYDLLLKATDNGNLTSFANLTIVIEDENDNAPVFMHRTDLYETQRNYDKASFRAIDIPSNIWDLTQGDEDTVIRIPESLPVGSRITRVMAKDIDIGVFGKIEYQIVKQVLFSGATDETVKNIPVIASDFIIEANTGAILVAKKLLPDSFYLLNITATDGGGLGALTTIPVSIYDVNDHGPKFKQPSFEFEVSEGDYVMADVGQLTARDEDRGENGRLFYSLASPVYMADDDIPFRIDETTGMITVSGILDREIQDTYQFTVRVDDGGTPVLSDTAEVTILVEDINDHPPEFIDYQEIAPSSKAEIDRIPVYRATVSEAAPPGSVITRVKAKDLDKPSSGSAVVLYKIEKGSVLLAIDSQDGTVYTTGRLDYETEPILHATVIAQDIGDKPLSASSLVTVLVEDVKNELSVRVFPQELYEVHTFENADVPQRLAKIQLSPNVPRDKNFHLRLVDSSVLSIIHLDPLSGDLFLISALDREQRSNYKFKIRAVESSNGRALIPAYLDLQQQTAENTVVLTSDNETEDSLVAVKEELSTSQQVINDSDAFEDVSEAGLTLPPLGRVGEVEALALDEAWIHLVVNDLNDNSPQFSNPGKPIVAAVSSDAMFGDTVTRIEATDPDAGINGEVKYELLPTTISSRSISYFILDTSTGELKVAGDLTEIAGEMVSFDIKATDRRGEDTGRSVKTSAFIHVLEMVSQVILELNAPPKDIHRHVDILERALTNVSGFEVHVQKMTPHVDGDVATMHKTDVYIYGVDPLTKELIRSTRVQNSLRNRHHTIATLLPKEISMKGMRAPLPQSSGKLLKSAELAILVGALVVFLACVSAIMCLCYRQRKSRRKPIPLPPGLNMGIAPVSNGIPILPLPYAGHYPAPYTHMSEHSDSSESTHVTSPDNLQTQQIIERPRLLPPPRFRVGEVQSRKTNKVTPQVTHLDDENSYWRTEQHHSNNGQLTDDECIHNCGRSSPNPQHQQLRGSHWHIRDNSSDPDGIYRRTARPSNQGNSSDIRCCNDGCSRNQGSHTCCSGVTHLPSPESLESNQQRNGGGRVPSTSNHHTRHKNIHGRLTSDVTEL